MRKRTTLNLDTDLLRRAQEEFGTSGTTETIHRALKEALAFRARLRLADHTFPNLTLESLMEMREEREFRELEALAEAEAEELLVGAQVVEQ